MTLAMVSKIVFAKTAERGEIVIRKVNSVTIDNDWKTLTDKAEITLPRNIIDFDKIKVSEIFRKGDPVEIFLGYDENLVKEFIGYIAEVSSDIPIKIVCDDSMFLLKKHPVSISMRSTKLTDLIKQIVPEGIETDVADMNIGMTRFPDTTAAKILEDLQKINIYSYFRGTKLIVGKIYSDDPQEPVVLNFNRNIIDNQLNYRHKEDVLIKIIVSSNQKKGKQLKVEFGDDGGTVQRLTCRPGITSKTELLKLAKLDYDKFKKDKLEGHIETFGTPTIQHGMKARIVSPQYTDREGLYWVMKVEKSFSDDAKYRQKVYLDTKTE